MDKAIKISVKTNQVSMRFNKSEPALFYEKREKAEKLTFQLLEISAFPPPTF